MIDLVNERFVCNAALLIQVLHCKLILLDNEICVFGKICSLHVLTRFYVGLYYLKANF